MSRSSCGKRWNDVRDSHQLLQSYWNDDPDAFDVQIRILSRNASLVEHERLCWHPGWHEEHKQQLSSMRDALGSLHDDEALAEFESRLARLLSGPAFVEFGLRMAQLPREMKKNYPYCKVPSPRDFGCRRLIDLIKTRCPSIVVEVPEGSGKAEPLTHQGPQSGSATLAICIIFKKEIIIARLPDRIHG